MLGMLGFTIMLMVTLVGIAAGQSIQVASANALDFYWWWILVLASIMALVFVFQILISAYRNGRRKKEPTAALKHYLLTWVIMLPTLAILWLLNNIPLLAGINLISSGHLLLGALAFAFGWVFEIMSLSVSWAGFRISFD